MNLYEPTKSSVVKEIQEEDRSNSQDSAEEDPIDAFSLVRYRPQEEHKKQKEELDRRLAELGPERRDD